MAPLVFYVPVAALAITSLLATLGPIDSKLTEKSKLRCKKITDDASRRHKDTKWSIEEILDLCEVSWKIREIKEAIYRDTVRVTWVLFGILALSIAGLVLTVANDLATTPLYLDLISYTDIMIVATLVVLLPFIARIVRQALQKSM